MARHMQQTWRYRTSIGLPCALWFGAALAFAASCAIAQAAGPPDRPVGDCSNLAPVGVFQEITPPEIRASIDRNKNDGGSFAIAVDPINHGTVYVGTRSAKLWKTTDCGATWTAIATGRLGADVNRGMNWTLVVDPVEPNVVYTNSGYGANGLFKSRNGGIDWDVIWPPPRQPELAKAFRYNFVNVLTINPQDRHHLLLTFHESCLPPNPVTCIGESKDGGETWRLIRSTSQLQGGLGQVIYVLDNPQTWLWGSQFSGFWRTEDSGLTWQMIPGIRAGHYQGSSIYRRQDGTFFLASVDGIWRSPDGRAATWKLVPNTGPVVGGIVSDGNSIYASTCYMAGFCKKARLLVSAENDGLAWREIAIPDQIAIGGTLAYDAKHRLLYSSNMIDGLWRMVVRP